MSSDIPPSRAGSHTGEWCTPASNWSAVRPPSQASQLPQGLDVWQEVIGRLSGRHREQAKLPQGIGVRLSPFAPNHSSGRALARLQLLILIHPPLREAEWRCSSGGQARSAARRSRTHREEVEAKPTGGDAPRWTPERRNAEPRRGAGRWGEPFWVLFWRLKKVPRRKGETISGRYRRNGYVHLKEIGRLSGRLGRDQKIAAFGSSYRGIGYINKNQVGPKAASAHCSSPSGTTLF